jgi:hypothetical protein
MIIITTNVSASEYFVIQTRSAEKLPVAWRSFQRMLFNYFILSTCNIFCNDTNVIIMYNITIINNYARLQDPILILKISMDTRKNFSENYRKFGHMLSKRLVSPDVGQDQNNGFGKHRYLKREIRILARYLDVGDLI